MSNSIWEKCRDGISLKKGVWLVILAATISGFANFFNKFGIEALGKDAFQYTTLKNVAVALILSLAILSPLVMRKLGKISKPDWLKLVLIGFIGGSVPFLLFFKGLSLTSAVSASFIHKTLFIWVAFLAIPILKEKITRLQAIALGILLGGNILFMGIKGMTWGTAETLILVATLFWAVENIIAKITLKNIDAIVLAWARMFFGGIFLIGFLGVTGNIGGLTDINFEQAGWLFLVSALLTGYVVTWYGALKQLPATVTASVLVMASPITTLLDAVFVSHQLPSPGVLWGGIMILAGAMMFWIFRKRSCQLGIMNYE